MLYIATVITPQFRAASARVIPKSLTRKMQLICWIGGTIALKVFWLKIPCGKTTGNTLAIHFNTILSYALMQFSNVSEYSHAHQELHHSMNKVLLQKTFQTTVPPINAFFWLSSYYQAIRAYFYKPIM